MNKLSFAIFCAGLIQGITLVIFPAASTILTSPDAYNFSSTSYGSLFISQALFALSSTAINPKLCRFFSSKSVFIFGLIANLLSMLLLALSVLAIKSDLLAQFILLVATAFLGIGFGFIVPTVNAMTAMLYPTKMDSRLLLLNALLGVGSTMAPILISIFVAFGFWWEFPLLLSLLLLLLILFSIPLDLPGKKKNLYSPHDTKKNLKTPFIWILAAFGMLYGIVETLNGNWVSIYMNTSLHATLDVQWLALTAFWGMITVGRFISALLNKFTREIFYQLSPFLCAGAFLILASLTDGESKWAVFASGLMGFGCSTLLSLTISFGSQHLKSIASSIPGIVLTYYLIGYGLAAFGVGPLQEFAKVGLQEIYYLGAFISAILGILSIIIVKRHAFTSFGA